MAVDKALNAAIKRHRSSRYVPDEMTAVKAAAIRKVTEWAGDNPVRLSLVKQFWPKGLPWYPASDLLETLENVKQRDHYVLTPKGIAVPPPLPTPTGPRWHKRWDKSSTHE